MISRLTRNGFIMVDERCQLIGKRFMFDSHCQDVIYFPGTYFEFLEKNSWKKERLLVFQVSWLLNILIALEILSDLIYNYILTQF